jgi:hypothetical protein
VLLLLLQLHHLLLLLLRQCACRCGSIYTSTSTRCHRDSGSCSRQKLRQALREALLLQLAPYGK